MAYKPEMTRAERIKRVKRQLTDNIARSRQSSKEWREVLDAYEAYLNQNSGHEEEMS